MVADITAPLRRIWQPEEWEYVDDWDEWEEAGRPPGPPMVTTGGCDCCVVRRKLTDVSTEELRQAYDQLHAMAFELQSEILRREQADESARP